LWHAWKVTSVSKLQFPRFLFKTVTFFIWLCTHGARGSIVIQAIWYKPEGRRLETRRGNWIYQIISVALDLGFYSASNRNEYQKHRYKCSWRV
jgi:hypothetical protein